jgi:hypothetical protein
MLQTQRFGVYLLVRELPQGAPARFAFRSIPSLEALGLDVGCDDMLQNFTTKASQKMNGTKPWRGPREKDSQFMQMLIDASSHHNDVVLDCTAMTGVYSLNSMYI